MGAKRTQYQIVGRYMSGKEVTGYHLQSIETGKSGKFSRDQVAFLIGREQITNCTAQIYQDKVLLRGKGMSLEDLPIQYEDGTTKNTEQLGKIAKGADASQVMEKFIVVGAIKSGRNTVGYIIQNAGCGIKRIKRQQVIELAQQGKIANARVQMYQGKALLRGVGCNLDELPSENIEKEEKPQNNAKNEQKQAKTKQTKDKTTRILSINRIKYNIIKTSVNDRDFEVNLVTFAVYNNTISKEELKKQLDDYIKEIKEATIHKFKNANEITTLEIKGKEVLGIFDDPYFKRIETYEKIAKRLNAKFVLDLDNVEIVDHNSDELTGVILKKAKSLLNKSLNIK